MSPSKCLKGAALIAAGALILLLPAIYNGYPFVYHDTGTYIECSRTLAVPADRPVGYSLLIRALSPAGSLWAVVVAQTLVLSFLLYSLIYRFTARFREGYFVVVCLLLSALTSLPWVTGMVQPDVFTPIMVLSLALLLLPGRRSAAATVACSLVFLLSISVHASHLLISGMIVAAAVFSGYLFGTFPSPGRKTVILVLLLLVSSGLVIPVVNYSLGQGLFLSRGSANFLMGRMWENGILGKYLDENCASKGYSLCRYRDEIHGSCAYFLWEPDSPFARSGGWHEEHDDYGAIVRGCLVSYPHLYARDVAGGVIDLLSRRETALWLRPYPEDKWVCRMIRRFYPGEYARLDDSRQQRGQLDFGTLDRIYLSVTCISLLVIGSGMMLSKVRRDPRFLLILFLVLSAVAANAVVCCAFAAADPRYQARIAWMLPLCALLIPAVLSNRSN